MSSTGTQAGGPPGEDHTTKQADFKPDPSTKYADWEEHGQATLTSDGHKSHQQRSGLEKTAGKVEEMTGKAMGDKELQARGMADQGKGDGADIQNLQTERGGGASYANRR
ncbi:hypothetical protein JCM8202_004294 [Rhodotorula sphaerocarpa]